MTPFQMNKSFWRWPCRLQSRQVKVSLAQGAVAFFISRLACFTISKASSIPFTFFTQIVETARTMEQKENFCLFFLLSLFHHFNTFGKLPASYQYPSFRTLTYMLLTKQSSCPYFSAPEFWEKEKLHLKSGGSQPSPRDAISEPGPISRHYHSAHQCGRRGRAPCVWPWLLFCGGTWRCGDWDNHTDRVCQGPRCDQQLNQVSHTFHLCLISKNLPLILFF